MIPMPVPAPAAGPVVAWSARLLEKPARLLTRILDRFRQMDIFRRLDKTNLPPALKAEIKADAAWKEDARNDFAGELALAHFALCDRIDKLVLAANAKPPEEKQP